MSRGVVGMPGSQAPPGGISLIGSPPVVSLPLNVPAGRSTLGVSSDLTGGGAIVLGSGLLGGEGGIASVLSSDAS